jgi:hypothetical protein
MRKPRSRAHKNSPPICAPPAEAHAALGHRNANTGQTPWPWLLVVLVLGAFAVDFWLDVRGRDALSWMDPYQYYNFALDVREGVRAFNQFELPSVFPLFILPFVGLRASIPSALCVNLLFAAILAGAAVVLCRRLDIRTAAAVVICAVLSSPLLLGLSRSLYMELALSAVVAVQYALWLRCPELDRWPDVLAFAAVFAFGVMMKMTYPLYIIIPLLLVAGQHLRKGRTAAALRLLLAIGAPALVVLAIQYFVFRTSFGYYLSLGNTRIPIMHLIGPARVGSMESVLYYPVQVGKTLLFLLAPFLAIPLVAGRSPGSRGEPRTSPADMRAVILWAWFLTPGLLLVLQPVKEPRHLAPCVLPGVLLIFRGIERVAAGKMRAALTAAVLATSLTQYVLVTGHARATPYFLDRPSHGNEIEEAMARNDEQQGLPAGVVGSPARSRWRYTRNVALTGLDANMALLLTWRLGPAVCYDVDLIPQREPAGPSWAFRTFEDLYFLTAFNTYNRRCGYDRYDFSLDRGTVVANADYVIAGRTDDALLDARWPDHERIMSLGEGRARIHLLARRGGGAVSYRRLYAREFLARVHPSSAAELKPICADLTMDALLRGDRRALEATLAQCPPENLGTGDTRNIYWTGTMVSLRRMAQSMLGEYLRGRTSSAPAGPSP